jgi:hypothetical protein
MRYLLFGGDCYYASGGGHDFLEAGDSIDDLMAAADEEWFHVFDTQELVIVAGSQKQSNVADDLEFDENIDTIV